MKKLISLYLLLLLFVLAACSSPDDDPIPTESPTEAAEVEVVSEATAMPTEAVPAATDTVAPTATTMLTATATSAPVATEEPTESPSPTVTATEEPAETATPDIPGSWANLQSELMVNIPENCPLIETEPNIFLHIPGLNGEAGYCASYLAFGQGFVTAGYDPDMPLPGDRDVDATVSLFQTNVPDDQFLDLLEAVNSGADTAGFSNYNILVTQQVTASCSGTECTAPLDRFLLDTEYTMACVTFTIRTPMHTAAICLIPSFSP